MSHVVIVGAGPAGASLALLLARRGIGVTLLERQTEFERVFRGEGLMPSGVQALTQMGLRDVFDAIPHRRIEGIEMWRGSRLLVRQNLGLTAGDSEAYFASQPALLRGIVAQASQYSSFCIERGVTVRDLIREGDRVVGLYLDSSEGPRSVRGDLVIGCDGRSSIVRRRAGFHKEATPQVFDFLWCKAPLPSFLEDGVARFYLGYKRGSIAYQSWDGSLQFGWTIPKGAFAKLRDRTSEEWIDENADLFPSDITRHLTQRASEISGPIVLDVVIDRCKSWTAPGLLLLGDAAHPMSPFRAQGINIALRDAIVAANHLVPVLTSDGVPSAIDSAGRRIQDERMSEVLFVQEMQAQATSLIFERSRATQALLFALLPLVAWLGLYDRFERPFMFGVTGVELRV